MGLGSTLAIASTASASPASSLRPGLVIAPRPTMPSACASVSRSATGCGCSRTAQRGRRQIIARDASAASTPAPSGRSASTLNNNLRSSGAAVEIERIGKGRIGFAVGAAAADQSRPAGQIKPRRREQVPARGDG